MKSKVKHFNFYKIMGKEKATKVPATAAPKMISVEEANAQMKNLMQQANQKIQQLALQVQNYDSMLRDKTIDNLFKVVEYAHQFEPDFVEKCTKVITEYLTKVAIETPEQPAAPEEKQKAETKAEDAEPKGE